MVVKIIPYEFYELPEIEAWLNDLVAEDLELVSLNFPKATFTKVTTFKLRYVVRWVTDKNEKDSADFIWKNLRIYTNKNTNKFPKRKRSEEETAIKFTFTDFYSVAVNIFIMSMLLSQMYSYENLVFNSSIILVGLATIMTLANVIMMFYQMQNRKVYLSQSASERKSSPAHKITFLKAKKFTYLTTAVIIVSMAVFLFTAMPN